MSKDFELLQRLEREWGRSSTLPDSNGYLAPPGRQDSAINLVQEPFHAAVHLTANLTAHAREELTRMILRTFLSSPAKRVVMFTGVEAQQGAKWIAAWTAELLADTSRARVCLLDADFACPTMHQMYSVPNRSGLGAVLAANCPIDRAMVRAGDNLWIVPAGIQPDAQAMTCAAFQQVIASALEECEYLVVAAPDFGKYTEIGAIGTATEGAVLVLDAVLTRRATAQHAKHSLDMAKVRVLGAVLNNQAALPMPDLFYTRM